MAFPTVAGTNNGTNASTTSHVVALPASIASGDLLVFALGLRTADTGNVAAPAGWSVLGQTTKQLVAWKIASGSEGASVTVTTTNASADSNVSYRITGHNSATSAPELGSATGSTQNPDPPSKTASWGALDNLWIAGSLGSTTTTISSFPTNYAGSQVSTNNLSHAGMATRNLNAATEDPTTFGLNASGAWYAFTIVVRPTSATLFTSSLSASLSFSGSISRTPAKSLTAALSFSGSLARRLARSFAAALSFSGSLAASRVTQVFLSAGLSFAGSLVKMPAKVLTASVSFSGSLVVLGIIADIKGLAVSLLSLIHNAASSHAAANSAATSDAATGDASSGDS